LQTITLKKSIFQPGKYRIMQKQLETITNQLNITSKLSKQLGGVHMGIPFQFKKLKDLKDIDLILQ
jgi:hypothetical protein